jgi:hypothetical protein
LADPGTPPERTEARIYVVLPEEAREWARQQGWPAPPLESVSAFTLTGELDLQLIMTRPDPGSIYHVSPNLPRSAQRIEVSARVSDNVALGDVTLYVDGVPFQQFNAPPYRAFWTLEPGQHMFMARGHTKEREVVWSETVGIVVRDD